MNACAAQKGVFVTGKPATNNKQFNKSQREITITRRMKRDSNMERKRHPVRITTNDKASEATAQVMLKDSMMYSDLESDPDNIILSNVSNFYVSGRGVIKSDRYCIMVYSF